MAGRFVRLAAAGWLLPVLIGALWVRSLPAKTLLPPGAPIIPSARALAPGKLLIASRHVGDPNFVQSVVLLISFSGRSAVGLIVNHQTAVPVTLALPKFPFPEATAMHLFLGGPVSADGALALLRSSASDIDGDRVLPDVSLITEARALQQAAAEGATLDRLRVFAGYAGWGAGQLEAEVARRDWFVLDGTSAVVFDPNPDTIWAREIRLAEAIPV